MAQPHTLVAGNIGIIGIPDLKYAFQVEVGVKSGTRFLLKNCTFGSLGQT
jgi:hypothetical protein